MNLFSVLYLGLRLTPFVLISFLAGWMVLNQDIRIMIFMAGFLITCLLTIFLGNYVSQSVLTDSVSDSSFISCNTMTLTNSTPLSYFPLSLVLYTFCLFYLLYIILIQESNIQSILLPANLSFIIFLSIISFFETIWLLIYCTFWWKSMISIILGSSFGLLWPYIISNTSLAVYQRQSLSNNPQCKMMSKSLFFCQ